jgi:hypothetical protein
VSEFQLLVQSAGPLARKAFSGAATRGNGSN